MDVPEALRAVIKGRYAILILLVLVPCAQADDAPEWAVHIMEETHKRVIVEHQDWYARDYRYIPAGQEVWGTAQPSRRQPRSWLRWEGIKVTSSSTVTPMSSPSLMVGCLTLGNMSPIQRGSCARSLRHRSLLRAVENRQ